MTNTGQPPRSPLAPRRALTHPLWIAALALLILNDHWLKQAGIAPDWFTGKLSDLAGLLVAPALLSVALRVRHARGFMWAHIAVGVGFTAINLSPAVARAVEATAALGPFPWLITVDPSDLLALPSLILSYRVFGAAARRPLVLRRRVTQLAFGVGILASVATSPPPEPGPYLAHIELELAIANATEGELIVRIRPLKEAVFLDCDVVAADPSAALSRDLFDAAHTWSIEPDGVISVQASEQGQAPHGECFAYLVDGAVHGPRGDDPLGATLTPTVLFWRSRDYPRISAEPMIELIPPARLITVTGDGRRAAFGDHPARYSPPPPLDPTPAEGCGLVAAEELVDWSLPIPFGHRRVVEVVSGRDGCHQLTFAADDEREERWYLCSGQGAMPFSAGDDVFIADLPSGQGFAPVSGVDLIGEGAAEGRRLRVARGADLVPWGRGSWSAGVYGECAPQHGPCGSLVVPLEVEIEEGDGAPVYLAAGERAELAEGTLFLRRAERVPVGDRACLPERMGPGGEVFESVYIEPRVQQAQGGER